MKKSYITQAELRELFSYNEDGSFTRLVKTGKTTHVGQIVFGSVHKDGYALLRANIVKYRAHRLVWIYHNGDIPDGLNIDHINGIRTDNRIENIRLATKAENAQNTIKKSNNSSGYMGVFWDTKSKKWRAQICHNLKVIHIGRFNCPKEAHEAYLKKKAELHTFNPVPRDQIS